MVFAPVGIRCPDHAGRVQGAARVTTGVRRAAYGGTGALVTKALIAVNVLIFLVSLAQGSSLSQTSGTLFEKGALEIHGIHGGLDQGQWWRLITAAFLHGGLLHIAFNMWALLWLGTAVEGALGHFRFLLLYLASGLAGSAGALLWSPNTPVVGASGAIFGILGAGFILEWRATGQIAGNFMTVIVINLAITFGFSSFISAGGHVGGLVGGIVCAAIIVARGRFTQWSDVPTLVGLVGVGALAVLVAYLKVHGMAA
jgi:membrane associated rhomboid family serine protease